MEKAGHERVKLTRFGRAVLLPCLLVISEDFNVTDLANGVHHCLIETSQSHESSSFIVAR